MVGTFEEVYQLSLKRKVTLRTAAYIIAISRLARAIELRGIFP
jgi:glutamate dehydrogenase/leucine dehydrogenase